MIWSFHNFTNHPEDIKNIKDGDSLFDCQFMSLIDDKFTLSGKKNLKMFGCNLVNVTVHNTTKTDKCNTAIIVFDVDKYGEITNITPTGKRTHSILTESEVDEILSSDEIEDKILWANYKHRIIRSRITRGKSVEPPKIKVVK